ncbi:MAG: site-2 protease family protein [Deferrisomatales bacterium]
MFQIPHVLADVALLAVPVLLAVTVHELAHGYVADRLGDPTARAAGRLTWNPLAHLDPVGTLVFVVTRMIGWAKPVPVTPSYFRNPRRGMMWVGLAGPGANLALAAVFAGIHRSLAGAGGGGWVLWGGAAAEVGVVVNVGLGVFNLIPVPPLDGSQVLAGLLPGGAELLLRRLERHGFLLLLVLVFSGALERTVYPVVRATTRFLLGA